MNSYNYGLINYIVLTNPLGVLSTWTYSNRFTNSILTYYDVLIFSLLKVHDLMSIYIYIPGLKSTWHGFVSTHASSCLGYLDFTFTDHAWLPLTVQIHKTYQMT